jgi:hypothetical protein
MPVNAIYPRMTDGVQNWGEGNLDTQMISAFGLNVSTLVSNTNTSSSTEEGFGFGQALLDFLTELAARPLLPRVLSISLGSLSASSCRILCDEAVKHGHTRAECNNFLQEQRQVSISAQCATGTRGYAGYSRVISGPAAPTSASPKPSHPKPNPTDPSLTSYGCSISR